MPALFALGAVCTLAGAILLVLAFRQVQEGDAAGERVRFRAAVAALAVGSLALLGAVMTGG